MCVCVCVCVCVKVNEQQVEMDKKFGTVHRAFSMLDRFSHPLPQRLREHFNTAPHRSAPITCLCITAVATCIMHLPAADSLPLQLYPQMVEPEEEDLTGQAEDGPPHPVPEQHHHR